MALLESKKNIAATQVATEVYTKKQDTPPSISPENAESFVKSQELVAEAIKRGSWGHDEMMSFRQLGVHLTPEQRDQLLCQVIVEMNSGRVKPDGIPF